MSTDENALKRIVEKQKAADRARLALRQQFERIDYKYDVVNPNTDEIKRRVAQGALPEFTVEDES